MTDGLMRACKPSVRVLPADSSEHAQRPKLEHECWFIRLSCHPTTPHTNVHAEVTRKFICCQIVEIGLLSSGDTRIKNFYSRDKI